MLSCKVIDPAPDPSEAKIIPLNLVLPAKTAPVPETLTAFRVQWSEWGWFWPYVSYHDGSDINGCDLVPREWKTKEEAQAWIDADENNDFWSVVDD